VLTFGDALQLLEEFDLSAQELVKRVSQRRVVPLTCQRDAMAKRVLRHFASAAADERGAIRFRDAYRLLEINRISLRHFLLKMSNGKVDDSFDPQDIVNGPLLGDYIVQGPIGAGYGGATVYLAVHRVSLAKAAVKWPVGPRELGALQDLQYRAPPAVGMPALLGAGCHESKPYVVMELMGADLAKAFLRLRGHPLCRRWRALRILGRLLLRRLEAFHDCGHVHCDVSPFNMMLGPARVRGPGAAEVAPFLIDLGQVRPHPGFVGLRGDSPSMEFSSVRSGEGGVPLPADDLEALGWTLLYGLFGALPWFRLLDEHYRLPEGEKEARSSAVIALVQEAKAELLAYGWDSLGPSWAHLAEVPPELDAYLRACRATPPLQRPDYGRLARLLGAREHLDTEAAELDDLRQYQAHVWPLV